MAHYVLNHLLFGMWIATLLSCAQQSSPTGGPRDETPPSIITESSTQNEQVYFEKQNVKLVFDEFVEIRKPSTSVIISPPFDVNPKIYARGKEIRIEMPENEELKENATYVINFGNSIRDFTEGNEVENYSFIFSTGPYIDSLSISGSVVEAYTGEPAVETLVMLYDELRDSVVYEQRPFYFARTDKKGLFTINNIRSDSFKLFVLKDENVNYLYDLDTEPIGFLDSLIYISADAINTSYDLELFSPIPPFDLIEYDAKTFGQIVLIFNQSSDSVKLKSNTELDYFDSEISGDSLIVWYDVEEDKGFNLILQNQDDYDDTLKIRQLSRAAFIEESDLELINTNLGKKRVLKPESPFILSFNFPLQYIDQEKCHLLLDTLELADVVFELDTVQLNRVILEYDFMPDSTYRVILDSAAVTSLYGMANDSINKKIKPGNEDDYGKIKLDIDLEDFNANYIVELMKDKDVVQKDIVTEDTKRLVYDLLLPKTYSLRVTKDDNKNSRWDPGSYASKTFSERIVSKELEEVKAGWDIEVVLASDIFDTKKSEEIPIDSTQQK